MNKNEVTSVKLVLFKYVMSFETLTKVDQLTEVVKFGMTPPGLLKLKDIPSLRFGFATILWLKT